MDLSNNRSKQFCSNTKGIIFFANPLTGEQFANTIQSAERSWHAEPNKKQVTDIGDAYANAFQHLPTLCLFEQLETKDSLGNKLVVVPFKGGQDVRLRTNSTRILCKDEDHYSITKPSNREHKTYQQVVEWIKNVVSQPQLQLQSGTPLSNLGNVVVVLAGSLEESLAAHTILQSVGQVTFSQPTIEQGFSYMHGFLQVHTTNSISSGSDKQITIILSHPTNQGSLFSFELTKSLLDHFKPCLAFFTGTCAGMKDHTNLGDLAVALMAFDYSQGIQTNSGMKYALQTYQPAKNFITFTQTVMAMKKNDDWKKHPQVKSNNPSARFKQQWFLRCLYELEQYKNNNNNNNNNNNSESKKWLEIHNVETDRHPSNITGVKNMIGDQHSIQCLIEEFLQSKDITLANNKELVVSHQRRVEIQHSIAIFRDYPLADKTPNSSDNLKVHWTTFGSGPTVRSDDVEMNGRKVSKVFAECQQINANTRAVDMEAAGFYQAVNDFHNTNCLVVKGISNHADSEKDDSFKEFGMQLAASYILKVIQCCAEEPKWWKN